MLSFRIVRKNETKHCRTYKRFKLFSFIAFKKSNGQIKYVDIKNLILIKFTALFKFTIVEKIITFGILKLIHNLIIGILIFFLLFRLNCFFIGNLNQIRINSRMVKLKSNLKCSFCSKIVKDPIELPCEDLICHEHLTQRDVVNQNKLTCLL